IKEMVGNRYKDANLCLQSIADTLGMNSSHVSRLFRKRESIPVHEYIKQVRLKHALQLLETNDQPIAEIMAQVGYSNISNFFRHFKQHYGTTPNQYRLKNAIDNSKGNQVL